MESIQVRSAELGDIPALVALMTEFYAESSFALPQGPAARTFGQLLADPRLGRVWLVERDGEIAGHVVLTLSFSMEHGGLRGFVDDLFVRPRFRGFGLSTAALAAVRRACTELGVHALLVEVAPDNVPAQRAYRRVGMKESGRMLLDASFLAPLHEQVE